MLLASGFLVVSCIIANHRLIVKYKWPPIPTGTNNEPPMNLHRQALPILVLSKVLV